MNKPLSQEDFLQLLEANRGIIIKICNTYCQDKNFREDLGQEIVYQLWRSGKTYNTAYRFSTWMYRIALNVAISFYRGQKSQPELVPYPETGLEPQALQIADTSQEESLQRMQQLIGEMNALDKALILLYLDLKTYAEIAEILGITETNVATKLSRIKAKLKQQMKRD